MNGFNIKQFMVQIMNENLTDVNRLNYVLDRWWWRVQNSTPWGNNRRNWKFKLFKFFWRCFVWKLKGFEERLCFSTFKTFARICLPSNNWVHGFTGSGHSVQLTWKTSVRLTLQNVPAFRWCCSLTFNLVWKEIYFSSNDSSYCHLTIIS
jgi:hypothetical protein